MKIRTSGSELREEMRTVARGDRPAPPRPVAAAAELIDLRQRSAIFKKRLKAVDRLLAGLPSDAKWLFLTSAKGSLTGMTPIEALHAGRLAAVKAAAQRFAET